jgi:GMP synthase (glutamine-hydrolysing)
MDGLHGHETIVVLDFGSQYTHLIARRLRECNVYCELHAHDMSVEKLKALNPKGIILSGGPSSVYEESSPRVTPGALEMGIPVLGICYGLQEIAYQLQNGSGVEAGLKKEYGHAELTVVADSSPLFQDVPCTSIMWMSHGDKVVALPTGFKVVATTANCEFAAVASESRQLYGIQFHPEVTHSKHGKTVLNNFVKTICGCKCDWTMKNFVAEAKAMIRETVGDGIVIGAVSGGVDSTVAAVLLKEALGSQFHAFLVDNGVMRQNEAADVLERLRFRCGVNLTLIDASKLFLDKLQGVIEPEKKRKIIGSTFIECFEKEATKLDAKFLLQGTLYPDVIESASHKGPAATIKSHHNVGGLPAHMKLKLIEPLRYLFKDEVRQLGLELGIERESVYRHPFPGPGLAIRIVGEITEERLRIVRGADVIYMEELRAAGVYNDIAQAFAVLFPCNTVGVKGDARIYAPVVGLRAVVSQDFMTAECYEISWSLLKKISTRIINEVEGVSRVVYDTTSKPPGTIEMT